MFRPAIQLNVEVILLYDRLEEMLQAVKKESSKEFAFDKLCMRGRHQA